MIVWGRFYLLLALIAGLLALAMPGAAAAQDKSGPVCHAYSDAVLPFEQGLESLAWRCDGEGWEDGRAVTWLRFDAARYDQQPHLFASRTTVFESIAIAALSEGRILAREDHLMSDATPVPVGPVFTVPLPRTETPPTSYVVRIARPHSVTSGAEATLWSSPVGDRELLAATVILALVTGMLVMPLLFDAMFYVVLRERFVLYHAGMVVAMILYALSSGGVLAAFMLPPIELMARLGPVAWAIGVGLGGLFVVNFIERSGLPRWQRRLLFWTAIWTMAVPGFAGLQLPFSQPFDNQLYFLAFLPVIPIYFMAIVTALLRGSRAARFLAAAWIPVVLASIDRLLRGMGVYTNTNSADLALFVSIGCEVIIVGLAIADRFLAVRRERDRALTEARTLEELTERDPLTGLLNRRAIQDRFAILRAQGFTTLAVIDLDHFKSVNDRYGHNVGDEALKCVAGALRTKDPNTLAFRLGGEEFVLMLRGQRTFERAEELRCALSDAVAEAELLPHTLTASMGMVDAPHEALADATFETLYTRADRLLYDAKAAGRDRTMSERLKMFRPRQDADRRAAA